MVGRAAALVDVFEAFEVPLAELGVEVPVADLPLARERRRRLQLCGPDGAVGEVRRRDRAERQGRVAGRIAVALDTIDRSVGLPARFLAHEVPLLVEYVAAKLRRRVREDVARMVEDHVENYPDIVLMCGPDQRDEIVPGAEVRIDIKEILDAVAVIRLLRRDLLEDRAHPDRGDAESLQVAHLGFQAPQRSADELASRFEPLLSIAVGLHRVAFVSGGEEGGRSGGDDRAGVVPVAILLAVREAVQHEEIENLVLPCGRRREEGSSGDDCIEVNVGHPLFHDVHPWFQSKGMRVCGSRRHYTAPGRSPEMGQSD